MKIKEFRNHFNKELSAIFPQTEIDSFFFLLIEKELGLQRIDLALNTQTSISDEKFKHLFNALSRLKLQEPIQYILGETEFYGLPFMVTKNTLIPRPETEELVDWVLEEVAKQQSGKVAKSLSILEIGTGTGCIPISLAKNLPNVTITAIDISSEAIKIAIQNADLNNVQIDFIEQDILTTKELPQQFDIIVSNPPYVRELEKAEIQPNVLENEPHLALFVEDNNPLLFYKKIAELAINHLIKKGVLFFEINQYLGKETVEMLTEKGFITELKKDVFGNNRMTKSTKTDFNKG
ncbi:Release factor glutamine methyltransferase [Polaribacter huanghezhanensis]|uniref:peptide chain release factor N(5)-glutamine methyltransferase n=1 Tax=Polaribacter huanghezhanensis TaxID=1354726 RepID=UPI002649F2EE|nr:peptide chain release factor N(5)-glutamine methyltransferase [Polaribacter huanghezhanensis]WKD84674.1 Release factor glutamine methyltransferase [Polaribacter huanghezhanensis]